MPSHWPLLRPAGATKPPRSGSLPPQLCPAPAWALLSVSTPPAGAVCPAQCLALQGGSPPHLARATPLSLFLGRKVPQSRVFTPLRPPPGRSLPSPTSLARPHFFQVSV